MVLSIIYGEAPPKRVTFSGFRYNYERVGISLVEVYEKVKRLKGDNMHFMDLKKSRKRSGFEIYSYLIDSALIQVKRDAKL